MAMRRTGFLIDQETFEKMQAILKQDDRTFSSWLRREMYRYVRDHDAIRSGKTQINMDAIERNR